MSDCDAGQGRATRRAATRKCAIRLAFLFLLATAPAAAQAPLDAPAPSTFRSLGQPPLFKPYVAGSLTWNREDAERLGGVGVVGVYKDLVLPISGAFGLSAEGYAGGIGSATGASGGWDGGARLFATSRLLFLNAGVDWNARTEKADFILAFTPYFRRGGLFGSGGNFRIEWIPGRNHSFNFGFQVPLEKHMGKTRPHERDARLPKASLPPAQTALDAGTRAQLATLRDAGRWLILHANFFNDDDDSSFLKAMDRFRADIQQAQALFQKRDADHPEGRSYALESRHYHDAFDAAFASAVGPAEGAAVSTRAREALLDEVLLPYDRLVGRFKKHDTLAGLVARGRTSFARSLETSAGLDPARRTAALAVYDEVAAILERSREVLKKHQDGDERKVWMSLDLALRPEQHDSQEEIDAVVARALARPFTRGNAIFPTNGSRFQLELIRALHAARDYHVLWIHDYAGRVGGKPDPVAHAVTTKGYLAALAKRVAEYDDTGRLPAFFLFQTQFFYEGSRSRLYLDLLEDPLGCQLKLGAGQEALEAEVREAQAELRRAVAGSKRLQAQAREQGGDAWLRKVIRVHVSVTFPADLSFRSSRVVGLPAVRARLRHPRPPQALLLRRRGGGPGPRAGGLQRHGRRLGVRRADLGRPRAAGLGARAAPAQARGVPAAPLAGLRRGRDPAAAAGARARRGLRVARGRARGLGLRRPSAERPQRGGLRPQGGDARPGDPLHPGAGGHRDRGAGLALDEPVLGRPARGRGPARLPRVRGRAVARQRPGRGAPILARTREVFARLLEVRRIMAAEIAASGGHLRVGLYTRAAASGDTLGKIREAAAGLRRHAFLADEFPMPADTPRLFDEVAGELEANGYKPQFIAAGTREGRPKMHRKTQLFVTRRALRAYADFPEVAAVAPPPARRAGEGDRGSRLRVRGRGPARDGATDPRAHEARARCPGRRARSTT